MSARKLQYYVFLEKARDLQVYNNITYDDISDIKITPTVIVVISGWKFGLFYRHHFSTVLAIIRLRFHL